MLSCKDLKLSVWFHLCFKLRVRFAFPFRRASCLGKLMRPICRLMCCNYASGPSSIKHLTHWFWLSERKHDQRGCGTGAGFKVLRRGFKSNQQWADKEVDRLLTTNYLSMRSAGCQSRQMPMPMPRWQGGQNQTNPRPLGHVSIVASAFLFFLLALMIALTMPSSARTATNDVAYLRNGDWQSRETVAPGWGHRT